MASVLVVHSFKISHVLWRSNMVEVKGRSMKGTKKNEAHKDLPEISESISESMHINLGGGFNHLFMFIPI